LSTHFSVGQDEVKMTSSSHTALSQYKRAATASTGTRSTRNLESHNALNLKNSHFPLGANNRADFTSNNMVMFKWVQPRGEAGTRPTAAPIQT
jgi:hypothetical protein